MFISRPLPKLLFLCLPILNAFLITSQIPRAKDCNTKFFAKEADPTNPNLKMAKYESPAVESKYYDEFFKALPSMAGKKVAITGCTSGTGLIAAKACAAKGATVVMLNRSSDRATKAEEDVKKSVVDDGDNNGKVVSIPCDLQSLESVKAVIGLYREAFPGGGLDVIACNAGIMAFPDRATKDGYDVQMQTNHLSHFKLVSDFMPELSKTASSSGEARVVMHTSNARSGADPSNPPILEEQYFGKNGGNLGGDSGGQWYRYWQTKKANICFTYALKDKLDAANSKVLSVVAHPGLSVTGLAVSAVSESQNQEDGAMLQSVNDSGAQSGEDGTMPLLSAMCKEGIASGTFFSPADAGPIGPGSTGKAVPIEPEEHITADEAKSNVWAWSEAAVGKFSDL